MTNFMEPPPVVPDGFIPFLKDPTDHDPFEKLYLISPYAIEWFRHTDDGKVAVVFPDYYDHDYIRAPFIGRILSVKEYIERCRHAGV